MSNNRVEHKPDPVAQQLDSTAETIDQVRKPIQHLETLINLCNDKGLNKTILKSLNDIKSFQNSVQTGVESGSFFGAPGMIVGFAIGTISFIKGRKRARKDAKKPDPFIQYLNANFEKINDELNSIKKSLQEMKQHLSDIYECQVLTLNLLHDGLTGLYQQNSRLEKTVIKLNQRVIDHVKRVQRTIEIQGKESELKECKQSWFRAEYWIKFNRENANVNNDTSKIQDILSNLINIIIIEGLATRSTLNGSASFKQNQVTDSSLTKDEWMLGELSNNDKSFAELVAFIAKCGIDRYKWQLELKLDEIDHLPNIDIWKDGVDAYIEFVQFCQSKEFKFPEETLYFDEIINAGQNFLKFTQYLQTPIILNLLDEYLSQIKDLETIIFTKFHNCIVVKNQDKQIKNYQHYLQKDGSIIKLCTKIDFTLVMFNRCVELAGYQPNEIFLLNNLLRSNQILEKVLIHSESVIEAKFRNSFPFFHLDMVKCIFEGIIPIYKQKISIGNYFSEFGISDRILLMEIIRSDIFTNNLEADSQNQPPITPMTTHIPEGNVERNKTKLTSDAKMIFNRIEKVGKNIKGNADKVFKQVIHNQKDCRARLVTSLPQHQKGYMNHVSTLFNDAFANKRVAACKIEIAQLSESDSQRDSDKVQEIMKDLIIINEVCEESTHRAKQQNDINNDVKAKVTTKNKALQRCVYKY